MIVVVAVVWNQNTRLKARVEQWTARFEHQQQQLEQARRETEILEAPDARGYEVLPVSLKSPPPPEGKAIYSRQRNGLIFMASHLPPLPAQKAYELWMIPVQGAPIPAGVFRPDAHGGAMVINPRLPAGVEAKAFAITIEPEQGSTTPTMPIVMVGAGG
jgi:anti-sigma-K factor RskA